MKMSRQKLDELIRHITKVVLKEYSSLSGNDDSNSDSGTSNNGDTPPDAMTDAEKRKAERDQKLASKKELDQAKLSQNTNKERAESYKSQYEEWRRYGKKNDDSKVKDMTKKVSSPPMGSTSMAQ